MKTISVKYQYEFDNYYEFCAELETISWNDLFAELSVDDMWACFYSRFEVLLDKYCTNTTRLTKLVLRKVLKKPSSEF